MNYRKLTKKLFNLSFIGRNFDHNYQGPSSFPRRRHVGGGGGVEVIFIVWTVDIPTGLSRGQGCTSERVSGASARFSFRFLQLAFASLACTCILARAIVLRNCSP